MLRTSDAVHECATLKHCKAYFQRRAEETYGKPVPTEKVVADKVTEHYGKLVCNNNYHCVEVTVDALTHSGDEWPKNRHDQNAFERLVGCYGKDFLRLQLERMA